MAICGWGGTPCFEPPRGGVRRGLCERHAAAIRLAWAKVGGSGRTGAAPQQPRSQSDYRQSITARRQARDEGMAAAAVEVVRERGEPMTRVQIAAALETSPTTLGRAVKLALAHGQLVAEGTGLGLPDWQDKAAA